MGPSRLPLACLPCRSQHLKCDGGRPHCSRCTSAAKECSYVKSRRGGLDRAARAARSRRIAAEEEALAAEERRRRRQQGKDGDEDVGGCVQQATPATDPVRVLELTSCGLDGSSRALLQDEPLDLLQEVEPGSCDELFLQFLELNTHHNHDLSYPSTSTPAAKTISPSSGLENDALVSSYYDNFHRFHPFLLPRHSLLRLYQDQFYQSSLIPLVAVVRLIGHIYDMHQWSHSLQDVVDNCLAQSQATIDSSSSPLSGAAPFLVQCRLLYSGALFWYDRQQEMEAQMGAAAHLAVELQMYKQEFATAHANGDMILAESWRRTWWTVYLLQGYYAGILGTMDFEVTDVEPTADLPCEEDEYESGNIPEPRTRQDFDCREFAPEDTAFSSFAYLIGAQRAVSAVLAPAPRVPARKGSNHVIQAADSILDGWLLLLPRKEKQVMDRNGKVDELMFQAELLVHVPYSDLKFNTAEQISSCARETPRDMPATDFVNAHTVRVLRSVEAQIRLLALPYRPFQHSPFVTCMISEGALALLSSCKYILQRDELAVARNQIRMMIGCLRDLADLWPRTAKNVREIQTIARHTLGFVAPRNSNTSESGVAATGDKGRRHPQLISNPLSSSSSWFSTTAAAGTGAGAVDHQRGRLRDGSTSSYHHYQQPQQQRPSPVLYDTTQADDPGFLRQDILSTVNTINSSSGWYDLETLDPGFLMASESS